MIRKKSFTLIELLVVIVIIGILAGVIMISTSSSIDKANFAKAQAFSENVKNSMLLDLISEWTFDEQTQTIDNIIPGDSIIYDDWGVNNGSSYGSIILRGKNNCIKEKCLEMNLSNVQYVIIPNSRNIYPGTGSFTVAGWIFPRDYTYPRSFFSMGNNEASIAGGKGWQLGHGFSNSGLNIRLSDGVNSLSSTLDCNSGYRPIDLINKWSHVVVVYDKSSSKVFLYVNGQKQSNYLNIPSAMGDTYSTQVLHIGDVQGWRVDGKLDEVAFYNEALSSLKVKQDYFAGLNSLLSKGSISKEDYSQRINELAHEK